MSSRLYVGRYLSFRTPFLLSRVFFSGCAITDQLDSLADPTLTTLKSGGFSRIRGRRFGSPIVRNGVFGGGSRDTAVQAMGLHNACQ
jgi:hypothetical protein